MTTAELTPGMHLLVFFSANIEGYVQLFIYRNPLRRIKGTHIAAFKA
jgi:hypothetical protein